MVYFGLGGSGGVMGRFSREVWLRWPDCVCDDRWVVTWALFLQQVDLEPRRTVRQALPDSPQQCICFLLEKKKIIKLKMLQNCFPVRTQKLKGETSCFSSLT